MAHHIYGIFDTKAAACAAFNDLVALQGPDRCSVIVHQDHVDDAGLAFDQAHVGRGAVRGAMIVGGVGAVIGGLIAGPVGLVGLGPLAAAIFMGGTGSVYGALIGALSGASDQDADRFADQLEQGKVIIAADPCSPDDSSKITDVLARHGGVLAAQS